VPQAGEAIRLRSSIKREESKKPPFGGCAAHHINQTDVIYVPKEMHQSIGHNIWTGKNMDKINALVGQWFTEDWT
jgi:hypothetical protein